MEDQKTTPKRSPRPKQSLAEVLLRTKNLSEGLKANVDIMNKRGIARGRGFLGELAPTEPVFLDHLTMIEIGRASCRERV